MTFDFDEQFVSCLHKDAWGYRPTQDWWSWWNAATDTQKQVEWDILLDQMEQSQSEETRMKEAALDNLNNKINMVKSLSSTPMSCRMSNYCYQMYILFRPNLLILRYLLVHLYLHKI